MIDLGENSTEQKAGLLMPEGIDRRSFLSIGAATLGGVLIPALVNPAMAVHLPERKGGTRRL